MYQILYVIFIFGYAHGLPEHEKENVLAAMMPHIKECSKEHGVSEHQIKEAKGTGKAMELHQCLMGCIYKSIGVIDSKGLFDAEKSTDIYKKYFSDPKDQQMHADLMNKCIAVNNENVTDGDQGCERGRLIFECLMPIQQEFFGQG